MKIDWSYPWLWGIDTKSYYKSLWLGWWLMVWTEYEFVSFRFQPGL